MNNTQLGSDAMLHELLVAARFQMISRWKRLAMNPIGMVGPIILDRVGIDIEVKAKTFFGRQMCVLLPENVSVSIWRNGFFEADVASFLIAVLKPGDVFVDVGGHFGFFSMLGSEIVGERGVVVTFEPMPATRKMLLRNMEENAARCRHRVVPAAAGSEAGKLLFKDFGLRGSAFATSEEARGGGLELVRSVEVDVVTIDSVVQEMELVRLDLIKIDAENAEAQVLQGAQLSIRNYKPAIILETGDLEGSTARPLLDDLIGRGYVPFEFRNLEITSHQLTEAYGYKNLLLVHEERLAGLPGFPGHD